MASLNLGWDTAYTKGLRQLASLAAKPGTAATTGVRRWAAPNEGKEETVA